jgi:hypothetical protein
MLTDDGSGTKFQGTFDFWDFARNLPTMSTNQVFSMSTNQVFSQKTSI